MVSTTAPRTGVVVVGAVGEIDLLTAPGWRRMLTAAAGMAGSAPPEPTEPRTDTSTGLAHRGPAPRLVCDLSPVTFLGASGLTVLVELAAYSTQIGVDLRVVAGNQPVRRLLERTALDRHLMVDTRLDRAVVSARSTGAAW